MTMTKEQFLSEYANRQQWALTRRSMMEAARLLTRMGFVPIAGANARTKEGREKMLASFELCDFVAFLLERHGNGNLSDYCAHGINYPVAKTMQEVRAEKEAELLGERPKRVPRANYDQRTNVVLRNLITAIDKIWENEELQARIFPEWYDHRGMKEPPMRPTISYGIYNCCARYTLYANDRGEPAELIALGVS